MDVINPEQVRDFYSALADLNRVFLFSTTQARIAEEAGACAVMALERVPADIRAEGLIIVIFKVKRIDIG